jgi:hypothetical protein
MYLGHQKLSEDTILWLLTMANDTQSTGQACSRD